VAGGVGPAGVAAAGQRDRCVADLTGEKQQYYTLLPRMFL
jgi:hypothetical protein